MSILGLGSDIVNINRIKKILSSNKNLFLKRILNKREFVKKITPEMVAKRFAAKEAFSKALGTGIGSIIQFSDIIIVHDKYGKPSIKLEPKINKTISKRLKVKKYKIFLSISDDYPFAYATVIISKAWMKKKIIENIKTLLIALILAIIIRSLLIQPFFIPSSSMENTLLIGDRLFVTKYSYGYSKHSFPFSPSLFEKRFFYSEPKRGDVIVFKTPSDNRTDYIKRLIGLPGDKIQLIKGDLFINDKKITKKFIRSSTVLCGNETIKVDVFREEIFSGSNYEISYFTNDSMKDTDPYVVPKDHFFFMGDNRDCSKDSRFLMSVGYVKKQNLVGKARFLFFSNNGDIGNFFTFWKWHKSIRFDRILKRII